MNQTPSGISDVASEAFLVGDLHVDVGQQRVTRAGIEIPFPICPSAAACTDLAAPISQQRLAHGTRLARTDREPGDRSQAGQLAARGAEITRKSCATSPGCEVAVTGWLRPCLRRSSGRQAPTRSCPRRWSSRNRTSVAGRRGGNRATNSLRESRAGSGGSCCRPVGGHLSQSLSACVRQIEFAPWALNRLPENPPRAKLQRSARAPVRWPSCHSTTSAQIHADAYLAQGPAGDDTQPPVSH